MQILLTDGNLRGTSPGTRLPSCYQDETRLGVNLFAFFEGRTFFCLLVRTWQETVMLIKSS